MAEKPILFSDALVRAILDGKKTETRRLVKTQPSQRVVGDLLGQPKWYLDADPNKVIRCPFGAVGDALWIRECFAMVSEVDDGDDPLPVYRADGADYSDYKTIDGDPFRWRPSIHMPRAASRITLEITEVRVERVQDITEDGARREGFEPDGWPARENFARAWDAIYTGSWGRNDWVWVVCFRRLS